MKPATRKALQGSIRKWIKVAMGTGPEYGYTNCPLCKLFKNPKARGGDKQCRGCPVYKATGTSECMNSPYDNEWAAVGRPDWAETLKQRNAALAELNFLINLLPLPEISRNRKR